MGGKHAHDHLVGRTIAGKFAIEGFLGSGAMGAVYKARQLSLDKTVAIKVLHGEHARDPAFATRFQREAKAASRLNHPNSIQIIDYGEEPDGLLYIAMEYLNGRSLFRILKDEWPLPPTRIADILMQTLAALAVAHDMGVIHRDIKPENIMVLRGTNDDGQVIDIVKVCDFGIAKLIDSRPYGSNADTNVTIPTTTTAGFLVGTPEYMSPEQGRGESLDPRSDLYSIGVILFQMLAGTVPFDAENAIGVVFRHITEEPPAPSSVHSLADKRLEAVCLKALRKVREERYQTAREMRADLRLAVDGVRATPVDLASIAVRETPTDVGAETVASAVTMQLERGRQSRTGVATSPGKRVSKLTLAGTEANVAAGPRRRRTLVALVGGLMALSAALSGLVAMRKLDRAPAWPKGGWAAVTGIEGGGGESRSLAPIATTATLESTVTPEPSTPVVGSSASSASPVGSLAASASAPTPIASAEVAPASASPAVDAGGSAPRGKWAHAGSTSPPHVRVAPPPSTSAPSDSEGAAGPDPIEQLIAPPNAGPSGPFDPSRAHVEIGAISAQGVTESALRTALRSAGLTACYRAALRQRGSSAAGVANLSVSVEASGVVRGVVLNGAEFLPEVRGCVQSGAASIRVPPSTVDPLGGTADVSLFFKVP